MQYFVYCSALSTTGYFFLCSTGTSDVRQTEAPVTRDASKLEVSVKIPTVCGSPNKPHRLNGGTRSPGNSTGDMMAAPMNRDPGADDLPVYSPMRRLPKQSSITDDNDSGKESTCHKEWDKSEIFKTPAIPSADVQRSNSYVNDSVVVRRPKPAVRARSSHRLSMPVMNASMLASHTAQFGKRESVIESLEKKRRESIGTRLKGLQVPVSAQHRNTSGPMKALPTIIGQKTQVGILPKLHPMTKRHSYQTLVPTTFNVKPLKVQPSAVYQMEPPKSRIEQLKDTSVESGQSAASAVRNDELNDKVDDISGLPGYTPVEVHDSEVSLSSCDKDHICVTKTNLANMYNMLNDDSADGTTDKKPLLPEQGNKGEARDKIVANDEAEMLPSVLNCKDEDLVSLPATTAEVVGDNNVTAMVNAMMGGQSGHDITVTAKSVLDTVNDTDRQEVDTPESQETLNTPEVGDPSPPQSDIVSLDIKQNFHGITIAPTSVAADVKSVSSPKPSLPPKPRKPSVPPKPSKARIMSSLDHSLNGTAADINEIDPMMKTEYAVNVKSSDELITPEGYRCVTVNDVAGKSGGVVMTETHNKVEGGDETVASSSLVDVTAIDDEIMVETSSQSHITTEVLPDMAPPLVPGITPSSAPDVVIPSLPAPELAQPSMPDTAPPSVPDVPPPAVPVAIPSLHDMALSLVPEVGVPLIPDMAPPSIPDTAPPSVPEVAPTFASDMFPPPVPDVALPDVAPPSITNEDPLVALEDTTLPLISASSFINNGIPSMIQEIRVKTEDTDLVHDIPPEFTPDVARPLPTYATPYEPEFNPVLLPDLVTPSNITTPSAPEITLSSEDTEEDNLLQNIIDAVLSSPTANAPDHPPFDITVSSPVDVTMPPPCDQFVLESDHVGGDASVVSAPMLSLPEINICPPTPTRDLGSPLDFKCDDVTVDVAADVTAAVVTDESTDVVADEVLTDVATHTVEDVAMDAASDLKTNTVVSDTATYLEAQEDGHRLESELQLGGGDAEGDIQIRTNVAFPISVPVTEDIPHGLDEIVSSHYHDPEISQITEPLKITTNEMPSDSFNAPQLPTGPPPTSPPPATPPTDLDLDLHATSGSVDLSDMSHFDSSEELEGNFATGALPQTSSPMISVALKEDEGRGSLLSSPDINGPLSPTPSDTDSGIYSSRAETSKSDTGGSYFFKSIFYIHIFHL